MLNPIATIQPERPMCRPQTRDCQWHDDDDDDDGGHYNCKSFYGSFVYIYIYIYIVISYFELVTFLAAASFL